MFICVCLNNIPAQFILLTHHPVPESIFAYFLPEFIQSIPVPECSYNTFFMISPFRLVSFSLQHGNWGGSAVILVYTYMSHGCTEVRSRPRCPSSGSRHGGVIFPFIGRIAPPPVAEHNLAVDTAHTTSPVLLLMLQFDAIHKDSETFLLRSPLFGTFAPLHFGKCSFLSVWSTRALVCRYGVFVFGNCVRIHSNSVFGCIPIRIE